MNLPPPPTDPKDTKKLTEWLKKIRTEIDQQPDEYDKVTKGNMYVNGFKHGMMCEQARIREDAKQKLEGFLGGFKNG